ncbi:DNA polymerase III subunit delta' [Pseudomaricurvus alkylphenolicus]|uniref:DNA polymerase III subunit delta' n=1 Tax=Pseudomaricurvus alkylphenolicus TaxID=1306991 RepID=UPI001421F404|nr:DNA polymerase III subunit delta' [Pseudomaricurvus alkylphenolicus]NIB41218.1 DNA polymerase III subunit delta' [Pseudomaricurvus alkylphenolicus]
MTDQHQTASLAIPYAWQQQQWQRVCQLSANHQLPHALLLAGPKGIGKRHFAQAVGYLMLCLSPVNQVPCGSCKGCELNRAETHPDLFVLAPEDGSRVIKIDQVRRLTDFIAKTSQQGGRKVAVIEPVEALNINAANALLKSLEEPSGDSLLLLVSHMPSQVMATIRSRCQQLEFPMPDQEQSLSWLTPLSVGQDAGYLLACSGGAPLKALELLEGDALEQRELLAKGLLALAGHHISALELAAKLQSGDPLTVVESVMHWLQQGLRIQGQAQDQPTEQVSEQDNQLQQLLASVPSQILFRFWDKLVSLKRQLLSAANPNKQLLLEELMMDWQALARQSSQASESRQRLVNGLI